MIEIFINDFMYYQIVTYKSLYQTIELKKKFQIYKGTLDSIFDDLIKILNKENKSKKDLTILAFHSPRIIRALVDYKEDHPKDLRLLELLNEGISTSLEIYKHYDNSNTVETIIKLRKDIEKIDPDILRSKLQQHPDEINLVVSEPLFSQATVKKLQQIIGNEEAIMFAVGHGSLGIGLDIVLRYEELTGRNLTYYPIRFSRSEYKGYKDSKPCLTTAEIESLHNDVKGKKIIVFDENHNTGRNITTVAKFISEKVAQTHNVEIVYNANTGITGKWAEIYHQKFGK
jgi:hypothetical protein